MICKIFFGLALVFSVGTAAVAAPAYDKLIYNEETKSYFELLNVQYMNNGQGPNWPEARKVAEHRVLGTTQGRLAILPSAQTELFIRVNLRPRQHTWFGLYYDCAARQLFWVNGAPLKRGDYTNWHPTEWLRADGGLCGGSGGLYPAFLSMGDPEKYWVIQTPYKRYYGLIVEYPTGGRIANEPGTAVRIAPQPTKKDQQAADGAAAGESAGAKDDMKDGSETKTPDGVAIDEPGGW